MKYILIVLFLITLTLLVTGFALESEYSQQLIGFGVAGLFFIVFPLFSYYHWKDKKLKDYMLTKENLDKMRESQKKNKY